MLKDTIKNKRLEKGYSQQNLADKIYVNQNTISQYESGKRTINANILEKIADELGYELVMKKKDEELYSILTMTHLELVDKINKYFISEAGVNMEFWFELCSDGNLDLYSNHKFTDEEAKKLYDIGFIDDDMLEGFLDDYTQPSSSLFYDDDWLYLPNHLFIYTLETVYGDGAEVVGVTDLDDYVQLTISIPN